ncbi:MAG: STAS domain-containing protein [Desulfuromonadaceae bacterium]|nr:STAS domain-containing protein [Desulfuromonadaceae bacterium]
MAKRTAGGKHNLSGDWTISGVMSQVDSLSDSLQKGGTGRKKNLHVDCARISNIDMSGLQLLHVWIECARMRGISPQLVNLPDGMQETIRRLGLGKCFTDSYPDAA